MIDKAKRARRVVAAVLAAPNVPVLPSYTAAVALRALAEGKAEAAQQKVALAWIINEASGMYRDAFHDSPRLTDFMLGRAFVGQQIVGALKLNLSTLQQQGK